MSYLDEQEPAGCLWLAATPLVLLLAALAFLAYLPFWAGDRLRGRLRGRRGGR